MKLVVQRVERASVVADGVLSGAVGKGLLVLVGVTVGDTEKEAQWLAEKTARLRVFEDEAGKMNLSALDVDGEMLVISNFTLYGNCRKGHRPNFELAARPEQAEPLYEYFIRLLREQGVKNVQTGVFGAEMHVDAQLDGPVTLLLQKEHEE